MNAPTPAAVALDVRRHGNAPALRTPPVAATPAAAPRLVHICTVGLSMRTFHSQLRFLQQRGYEIHVISSADEFHQQLAQEAIGSSAVAMTRQLSPLRDALAVLRLVRRLKQLRPQIVHAHTPKGGLLGTVAAYLAGVPVRIYHIRGFRFETTRGWKRRLLLACERLACRLATHTICSGQSLRETAIEQRLVSPQHVSLLAGGSTNGVDAGGRFDPAQAGEAARSAVRRRHGIPADATVISFVGRMARDKGLVDLEQAWQTLRRESPKLYLLLVGWLETEDPLPADVVQRLRQDPRVVLAGRQWDTAPYYAASDLFCLPSYREGLAGVLLEAGAMALPAVTTTATGCRDVVVDGQTGQCTPPGDVPSLTAALRRYVADPALRRQHGRAARRHILANYRSEVVWDAVQQLYARQLAARTAATDDRAVRPATADDAPARRAA